MARSPQISQSLLKKLALVSKEEGVRIEVERNDLIIRICPNPVVEAETTSRFFEDDPPPPIHPRLDLRERSVMEFVELAGVGNSVDPIAVRNTGPHTYQRLKDRGFIEVFEKTVGRQSWTEISLTEKGCEGAEGGKGILQKIHRTLRRLIRGLSNE